MERAPVLSKSACVQPLADKRARLEQAHHSLSKDY